MTTSEKVSSGDNMIKAVAEEAHMRDKPIRVLAVDDEEFNLEILAKHIRKAGFEAIEAHNGEEAWAYLDAHPNGVDIILMDKMMPGINGLELTKKIKADPRLKHIVIIMQTASVGTQAVVAGIEAGAYYYLTKPYAAEVLVSIVSAAARDYRQQSRILNKVQDRKILLNTIKKAEFAFSTIEEARALAVYISNFCPEPGKVALGLAGLLVNAVEHGNLGIGYQRKTELLTQGTWEAEIHKRLAMPEYKGRQAHVKISRENNKLFIHIKDEGKGFDPKPYLDFDPSRITDPNGRGIAMAKIMENTTLQFLGAGNEVLVTVRL